MTEEEILDQITEIKAAMAAIRNGGQSYIINSGGSNREVVLADYAALKTELRELQRALAELQGSGSFNIQAGW